MNSNVTAHLHTYFLFHPDQLYFTDIYARIFKKFTSLSFHSIGWSLVCPGTGCLKFQGSLGIVVPQVAVLLMRTT